jgi:hypothetical protein
MKENFHLVRNETKFNPRKSLNKKVFLFGCHLMWTSSCVYDSVKQKLKDEGLDFQSSSTEIEVFL